jgi:short-subunit dehydrogenase
MSEQGSRFAIVTGASSGIGYELAPANGCSGVKG